MQLIDFSPPTVPSLEQQRDALQKGLGRSMIWATTGHLDETTLLDACLHDWRFDGGFDEYRGDWLWEIMKMVHVEDQFRGVIFEALNSLPKTMQPNSAS